MNEIIQTLSTHKTMPIFQNMKLEAKIVTDKHNIILSLMQDTMSCFSDGKMRMADKKIHNCKSSEEIPHDFGITFYGKRHRKRKKHKTSDSCKHFPLIDKKVRQLPKDIKEELRRMDMPALEKILDYIFELEKMDDLKKFLH